MAVTVPDWADTLLDLIGVAWPNVDEDAYREMADALREFADDLEDDGQLANNHFERLLSSGQGEAIDALDEHWQKVKGKHFKDIAGAARTIAGGLDLAAGAVEGMKLAALVQLGYLASEAGIALSLIPVTGGLSALIGAGAMRATQEVVKRLIKECVEEAVGYVVSALTEPAVAALEGMAADLVVQLGAMAIGLQDGVDLDQAEKAGTDGFKDGVQSSKDALHLASAGGGRGGGAKGSGLKNLHIEHAEHDHASTQLNTVSVRIHGKTAGKLTKAKTAHGRTRGRDSIADAIDPVADKAMEALTKAAKSMGDHVGQTLPKVVKQISADHKNTDDDLRDRFARQRKGDHDDSGKGGSGGGGGGGGNPPGGNGNGGSGNNPGGNRITPAPPWHGSSAGNMRHHRTDPLDVSHLTPEQQREALVQEARDLADKARRANPDDPNDPKHKIDLAKTHFPPGTNLLDGSCAGSLLHDGVVTSHSSATKGAGQKTPDLHPAMQSIYDQVEQRILAEDRYPGAGHGKCAEANLVSDRLRHLDPDGTGITSVDQVRDAMKGSQVYSVQIGEQIKPHPLGHGEYKPPCRSCALAMEMAGVTAYTG
ncbi:YwqJ-related putative deaminase [Streptomyces sp. NPDC020472]|uniref:YwqJ-related putative deaminase n=1 Tax=Streptomyces sp. NPDC020472 TaxID=3365075 RepID=UPI0037A7FABA